MELGHLYYEVTGDSPGKTLNNYIIIRWQKIQMVNP